MDYRKEYDDTKEWHKKVSLIALYHSQQYLADKRWTLTNTAMYFGVSIGLVSENVRLAKAIDKQPLLIKLESRQKALDSINRRNGTRIWTNDEEYDG